MDGYTAESRAGEILLGAGIGLELHYGLMREVAPGWKLRVLLAQALFSDPDILLLDEPLGWRFVASAALVSMVGVGVGYRQTLGIHLGQVFVGLVLWVFGERVKTYEVLLEI